MKTLAYWRKNYLFGVARPAALSFDGTTFTCLDNALAPVFGGPLSSVTVKKGFGIFKVSIDGERVGYLTPTGSTTAPSPSPALLHYLQHTSADSPSGADLATTAATGAGAVLGGAAGATLGAASDAFDQAWAVVDYSKGMTSLGRFLTSIGALQR